MKVQNHSRYCQQRHLREGYCLHQCWKSQQRNREATRGQQEQEPLWSLRLEGPQKVLLPKIRCQSCLAGAGNMLGETSSPWRHPLKQEERGRNTPSSNFFFSTISHSSSQWLTLARDQLTRRLGNRLKIEGHEIDLKASRHWPLYVPNLGSWTTVMVLSSNIIHITFSTVETVALWSLSQGDLLCDTWCLNLTDLVSVRQRWTSAVPPTSHGGKEQKICAFCH